jgi:hypothetical protein
VHSNAEIALFGFDRQLHEYFGRDFAKSFMQHFRYDEDVDEPFFRRAWTTPYQTRPLQIKDTKLEMLLGQHFNKCDDIRQQIGNTVKGDDSLMSIWMNKVREEIMKKLTHCKHNLLQSVLVFRLFEAMPTTALQKALMPSVMIQVPGHEPITLAMQTRQKTRARCEKEHNFGAVDEVAEWVKAFQKIRAVSENTWWMKADDKKRLRGVIESMGS